MTSSKHPTQESSIVTQNNSIRVVSNLPSCLGDVSPFFEPLKVCLDDDSSFDENDEYDDDDFFIEDYEVGHGMDICPETKSPPQVKAIMEGNKNGAQANQGSTLLEPFQHPPENAARSTFHDTMSNNSSLSSPFCLSSGTLTSASGDSSLDTKSTKPSRSKRKVSLHEDVVVVPIPMREEYSDRVKERLWSSASELYLNAARNSIEFAAEGFNWRNVTEDENMIVCDASGEMIHPIHLHNFAEKYTSNNGNVTK